MPHPPVFLFDRDGTVIMDKHYLSVPAGVELLPGAGETLGSLARQGARLFLVSNQSGVGRGMFPAEAVDACNQKLAELLLPYGAEFEDMVFCPHSPEEGCTCRKPAIGMWENLRARHHLSPATCIMVGDKEEDMLFGANAAIATRVLVLTGKGRATAQKLGIALPSGSSSLVACAPISKAHPHLCIPGLGALEEGLALLANAKETPCPA